MKLFIDWETGTWGDASNIVIFDADDEGMRMDENGDAYTVLSFLDNASDGEINKLAADIWHRQRGY